MNIDRIVRLVERFASPPNYWLHRVAMLFLLLLMFLTVGDVIGRYLVGRLPFFQPIPGTFEMTEFMLVIIVLSAIGYVQVKGEHISIDILVSRFTPRTRGMIDSITSLLSLAIFALVTWQSIEYAQRLFASHDVSAVLRLPVYPFLIVVAVGSFMFCLAMLASFLQSLRKVVRNEP